MKECFIKKNFSKRSLAIITCANSIIDEYKQQGLKLTLRQLYYQFVSRDLIPNKQSEYKRLGSIINDARLAGNIDWSAIEDRTRSSKHHDDLFKSPEDIINVCCENYSKSYWERQPNHVEVWVEKEALAGVIEDICSEIKVTSFACKGYTSQSEMFSAGLRIRAAVKECKEVKIIHLGDHDPSGIDMTRDIEERLTMFGFPRNCDCDLSAEYNICSDCLNWQYDFEMKKFPIQIKRIALNYDQIKLYNPPPNPAKSSDSRFKEYQKIYGNFSWELDALNPTILRQLIQDNVSDYIDEYMWDEVHKEESNERENLRFISENYQNIMNWKANGF